MIRINSRVMWRFGLKQPKIYTSGYVSFFFFFADELVDVSVSVRICTVFLVLKRGITTHCNQCKFSTKFRVPAAFEAACRFVKAVTTSFARRTCLCRNIIATQM